MLEVIYLIFNEGYAATAGEDLVRPALCGEARRLGCSAVTLNVWEGNDAARRFYEKMGMTPRSATMELSL